MLVPWTLPKLIVKGKGFTLVDCNINGNISDSAAAALITGAFPRIKDSKC